MSATMEDLDAATVERIWATFDRLSSLLAVRGKQIEALEEQVNALQARLDRRDDNNVRQLGRQLAEGVDKYFTDRPEAA